MAAQPLRSCLTTNIVQMYITELYISYPYVNKCRIWALPADTCRNLSDSYCHQCSL